MLLYRATPVTMRSLPRSAAMAANVLGAEPVRTTSSAVCASGGNCKRSRSTIGASGIPPLFSSTWAMVSALLVCAASWSAQASGRSDRALKSLASNISAGSDIPFSFPGGRAVGATGAGLLWIGAAEIDHRGTNDRRQQRSQQHADLHPALQC